MSVRNQIYANSSPARQAGSKCNLILQKCLAIQLVKTRVIPCGSGSPGRTGDGGDYWMYDNGYLLFQGFLEANSKCFWNLSLLEAMKELQFEGYVSQGMLLVRGSPCALEVLRNAWSRNVLKAPTNYTISQVVSMCGGIKKFLNLNEPSRSSTHDRIYLIFVTYIIFF